MSRPRKFMKEDVIEFMENADEPFITATELAEELDCAKRTAHDRLQELHEDGMVRRKKVGGRAVVYWLPSRETTVTP